MYIYIYICICIYVDEGVMKGVLMCDVCLFVGIWLCVVCMGALAACVDRCGQGREVL